MMTGWILVGACATLIAVAVALVVVSQRRRALRPSGFFVGFAAIIVAPQLLFHGAQALAWIPPAAALTWTPDAAGGAVPSTWRVDEAAVSVRDGAFAAPARLFGPSYDSTLVVNLRVRIPDGPLARADAAAMAVLDAAATLTVARFADNRTATEASAAYLAQLVGAVPRPDADGRYSIQRANDAVTAVITDRTLLIWSGPDSAAAARAMRASPWLHRGPAPDIGANAPARAGESVGDGVGDGVGAADDAAPPVFWLYRPWTLAVLMTVLVAGAVSWFVRMVPWATEVPARPGVAPVTRATLRDRLLAVNDLDAPIRIEPDPRDPQVLIASWRYADATWVDFARAHTMTRTHRIIMRLDEPTQTVRPIDQQATFDASVGPAGGALRWRTERGIVFYQREVQRVFGLQLDASGRPTRNLTYSWRFDIREMKAPLIDITTAAGWRWRPSVLP